LDDGDAVGRTINLNFKDLNTAATGCGENGWNFFLTE
jgi:hypothetical protein